MSDQPTSPGRQSVILRRLLFIVFVYAGLAYGGSLLEYTLFNLTGSTVATPVRSYTTITPEQIKQEFLQCGSPLFAATGTTSEPGEMILTRCGRYWPFYRYTVEMPANPLIPGAFVLSGDEADEARAQREQFMNHVSIINGGFALVSCLVLGMTLLAVARFAVRRDEEGAYSLAFKAFVSSFLMLAGYTGFMFFVDPTFRLGW
ncbi:MAG: hypothetical protein D6758_08940 [Gammaproteobacteria bacterium]|nr:MAG: hypothetical protein D6758_08940 [Gammaproteobacteria bacterium]